MQMVRCEPTMAIRAQATPRKTTMPILAAETSIFPENLLMIASAALLATLLSGLYPAWKAGRVVPVESIRLV